MLKRYQVLLPDWMEDYVKYLADKFDLKFTEVIRAELCCCILTAVSGLYPEHKSDIKPEEISKWIREKNLDSTAREEMHQKLSKLYFEARKAVEFLFAKEKKPKKK